MALHHSSQYYHAVLERIPPRATPPFEDPGMQERVWGRRWGVRNDVGTLRTILLHRPENEILAMTADRYDPDLDALINDEEQWYFRSDKAPDLTAMQREFDALVALLREHGVEIVFAEGAPRDPNAVFVRDNAMIVDGGAVLARMGPVGRDFGTGRRGEERFIYRKLAELGMPVLHMIHGEGLMEGGSFCLLNEKTAAVGMSFRGNRAGAAQLRGVLATQGKTLIEVPLPGYAMHLDGGIVMVDHRKAVVNVERLPYWFLDTLKELDIQTIPIDHRDSTLALNCLPLAPGKVIMDAACPHTAERLTACGVEVRPTPWTELAKHGGGIHCATLPLVRDDD